jgi:hypothetical protein
MGGGTSLASQAAMEAVGASRARTATAEGESEGVRVRVCAGRC